MQQSVVREGRLTLDFSTTGTSVTARHDAYEQLSDGNWATIVHDQRLLLTDVRLSVEYGLTSGFALSFAVPYRVVDTSIRYLDANGDQVSLAPTSDIHHRNETLTGPGDPWVTAYVARRFGPWTAGARGGFTLPLGRTVEDPFLLGEMGLPHEHIQLGTGTVDVILGADTTRAFPGWQLAAWALTTQVFYANAKGYQAGDHYGGGISARTPFGTRRWTFEAGVEGTIETAEVWNGKTYADEGNHGRVDLLAGAGVSFAIARDLAATAVVKVPFYTDVGGGQMEYPALLTVGVSGSFDLARPRRPALPTVIAAPAESTDGKAIDLTTAPGKYTLWDFWAPWCKPCKLLTQELEAVAAEHPELEIRRLNVVDWDSPAAARYLAPGHFALPHLKLFGPDGKLLFERSGSPAELRALVEDQLNGGAPIASGRVAIRVTDAGFEPAAIRVRRGDTVTLVFTRETEDTCATEVTIALPEKITAKLPLGQPVEVPVTFPQVGDVAFGCSMDMIGGHITVVPE